MIRGISFADNRIISFKSGSTQSTAEKLPSNSKAKSYTDSFIKQSKKSIPVLGGVTLAWSLIDKANNEIPLKQAIPQNFVRFFMPVLLVSSAILAGIETRNNK